MRFLSVLACLFCVGAAAIWPSYETIRNQEYHYEWLSRVTSGVPELAPQLAGVGTKARFVVVPYDSSRFLFKVLDIQQVEINDKFDHIPYLEENIELNYQNLTPEQLELIKEPFLVKIENGKVIYIQVNPETPTWLLNYRKASVNVFSISPFTENVIPETFNEVETFNKYPYSYYKNPFYYYKNLKKPFYYKQYKTPLHYTVLEETTVGECETTYSVSPVAEYMLNKTNEYHFNSIETPEDHLIIIKTINYEKCTNLPSYTHKTSAYKSLRGVDTTEKSRTSTTHYLVEGDLQNFTIKNVFSYGQLLFKPLGINYEQKLDITTVFSVKLVDVKPVTTKYQLPQKLKTISNLMFKFPEKFYQGISLVESPIRYFFQYFQQDVGTYLINDLIKSLDFYRAEEIKSKPAFAQSLVYSLQNLNLVELKTLYEKLSGHKLATDKYVTAQQVSPWEQVGVIKTSHIPITNPIHDATTQLKLDVLIDLLAMTGTNPSYILLNTLMFNGQLTGEKAAQVLMVYPTTIHTPTPEFIQEFVQLLKTVQDDEILTGAGMLALSNIVHDYCVDDITRFTSYPSKEFFYQCHPQHEIVIYDVLPFLTQSYQSYYLTLNKITALGNLGIPEVVPYLKPYVYGYNVDDLNLRTTAIYALRIVAKTHPQLVVDLLLPVYKNVVDSYVVRKAAVTVIFISNPEYSVFQQVATYTWVEPNQQIQNYVYSFFKALSTNTFNTPYFTELKYKANKALEVTKPVKYGVVYPYVQLFTKMFYDINEGVLLYTEAYQHEHGLQSSKFYLLFKQVFGDIEYTGFEMNFFLDYFTKAIQQQFGLKTTQYAYPKSYLNDGVWFKFFNTMERFVTVKNILKTFDVAHFSPVQLLEKLVNGFEFVKVLPGAEFMTVLPTDLGYPVFINAHTPKFFSLKGKVKGLETDHVTFELIPHFEQELHFQTYFINPLTQKIIGAAVKVHDKIQVPVTAVIDTKLFTNNKHLSFSLILPKQHELQVFREVVPFTFYKQFDFKPYYFKDSEYFIIKTYNHVYEQENVYGKELFGLSFKTGFKSDRPAINLKNYDFFTILSDYFLVPTSWNYHNYYLTLDHQQSTTEKIYLETFLKGQDSTVLQLNFKFEGQQTHTFGLLYDTSIDTFNLFEKNITLKLHQTHPNTKPQEFVYQYYIQYPENDVTKQNVDITSKGFVDFFFGEGTTDKSYIRLKYKLEQTPEQQKYAKSLYHYKKCSQDTANNYIYSHHCLTSLLHLTTFDKYSFDVVYSQKQLPTYVYYYLNTLFDLFKYNYYTYTTTTYPQTNLQPGNLAFTLKYHPYYNTWDVKVVKPNTQLVFNQIPEVPYLDYFIPRYVKHPLNTLAKQQFPTNEYVPYCMLQSSQITTFDNFTYPLTEVKPECWRIMLKNCFNKNSKFYIMSRYVSKGHEIRIKLDDVNEIYLTPTTGKYVKFTINGKEQVLPTNNKKEFTLKTVTGRLSLYAGHLGTSFTVFDFPKFTIYHDGKNVWIQVNPYFKNEICGTCGNFNGEIYDEYYTSHTCIHESRVEFLNSWIFPDGVCTIPKVQNKQQCHIPKIVPTVEALYSVQKSFQEENYCKEYQQNVIYYKNKICVSVQKLPFCKTECTALFLTPKKAPFYCAPINNSDIKTIAEKVHSGTYVDLTKYPYFFVDVSYPEVCLQH